MPKHNVFQLIGDLRVSNGKWEFGLEGFCWKNAFGKRGVFPFPTLPEEAVHISFGSLRSFNKVQFVFKLQVLVVLAEVACCYVWGFNSLILLFWKNISETYLIGSLYQKRPLTVLQKHLSN